MEKVDLFRVVGNRWSFHPIGTGTIFTYNTDTMQVIITCVATGRIINTVETYKDGGYAKPEIFKSASRDIYLTMVEDSSVSLDFSFFENTTYVGDGMVEVDFDLLKN